MLVCTKHNNYKCIIFIKLYITTVYTIIHCYNVLTKLLFNNLPCIFINNVIDNFTFNQKINIF